jgi:hypothetical protein
MSCIVYPPALVQNSSLPDSIFNKCSFCGLANQARYFWYPRADCCMTEAKIGFFKQTKALEGAFS